MQDSKYSKVLTIVLIVIVVLIIGLLIFWGVDTLRKRKIQADGENAISAFKNNIITNTNTNTNTSGNLTILDPYGNSIVSEENTIGGDGTSGSMQYKGFTMLGSIEIPKTGLKSPVLAETTKAALEVAVARLYGPGLNQVGNTVIVGHNYRNGTFFSDNAKLTMGDVIYITDEKGQTLTYTIYKKYQTTPEDADYATRDTNGAKEITLSTCTDDSDARIIILAKVE